VGQPFGYVLFTSVVHVTVTMMMIVIINIIITIIRITILMLIITIINSAQYLCYPKP